MSESTINRLVSLRDSLLREIARLTHEIESIPADEYQNYDALVMQRAKITFQLKRVNLYFED